MVILSTVGSTGLSALPSSGKSAVSSGTTSSHPGVAQAATSFTPAQTSAAPSAQLYSLSGLLPASKPIQVWELSSDDAMTALMRMNYASRSSSFGFKDLGAALLERFKTGTQDTDNFSQSIVQFAQGTQPGHILEAITQTQLHTQADNQIALSIQTVGGAQVQLTLGSQENGLAVQVQVTDGTLTEADREALAKLSGAFQNAIDGLAKNPPQLDLAGLTQFDSTVLLSVKLQASLKVDDAENQLLEFHADSKQRTVSLSGPIGTMKVSVDLTNPAILGSAKQQAKAVDSYLKQFDYEQRRGHGDVALMTMFKDAFAGLNSNYPATAAQQLTETAVMPKTIQLNQADRSLLTGLADFSASVTQNSKSSNPRHPGERDTFSYQLSQDSGIKEGNPLSRSIVQKQQSHLSASYHESLIPDLPLKLTTETESQNYIYHQINDEASSVASISYEKGVLLKASLIQSASQSEQIQKYVMGKLEEDRTTSRQTSHPENFLARFTSIMQSGDAQALLDSYLGQQALSAINDLVVLQPDPDQLEKQLQGQKLRVSMFTALMSMALGRPLGSKADGLL